MNFYIGLITIFCYLYTIISIIYILYTNVWYHFNIEREDKTNE